MPMGFDVKAPRRSASFFLSNRSWSLIISLVNIQKYANNSNAKTHQQMILCCKSHVDNYFLSDEARLIQDLQKPYSHSKTLARPVLNSSHTITVHFGVTLIQILDFDMKNQVLTTLLWKEYVSKHVCVIFWEFLELKNIKNFLQMR